MAREFEIAAYPFIPYHQCFLTMNFEEMRGEDLGKLKYLNSIHILHIELVYDFAEGHVAQVMLAPMAQSCWVPYIWISFETMKMLTGQDC